MYKQYIYIASLSSKLKNMKKNATPFFAYEYIEYKHYSFKVSLLSNAFFLEWPP